MAAINVFQFYVLAYVVCMGIFWAVILAIDFDNTIENVFESIDKLHKLLVGGHQIIFDAIKAKQLSF